jgi:hypothetical protein
VLGGKLLRRGLIVDCLGDARQDVGHGGVMGYDAELSCGGRWSLSSQVDDGTIWDARLG